MIAFLGLWRVWLALALIVGAFLAGVRTESDHRDSQQLALERGWHDTYVKTVGQQRAANAAVSTDLAATRAAADTEARTLRERIRHATALSTCLPVAPGRVADDRGDPDPGGVPRFSAEFIGLWNGALFAGLPAAERAGGAAVAAAGPDTVEASDLLENHVDNAALCNDLRAQIRTWQAWAGRNGLMR